MHLFQKKQEIENNFSQSLAFLIVNLIMGKIRPIYLIPIYLILSLEYKY